MAGAQTTDESRHEDSQLVADILAGDRDGEACRRLVGKYWKLLVAWVRPRLPDPSLAEDVVQEAFIRAFQALDRLEDAQCFLSWLLRIALNRAADVRRQRRHDRSLDQILADRGGSDRFAAAAENLDEEMDRESSYRAVLQAVDRLPEKYRAVILLRYFEGLSGPEIAAALGEPEGTIRNRLFRAHAKIRRLVVPSSSPASGSETPSGGDVP